MKENNPLRHCNFKGGTFAVLLALFAAGLPAAHATGYFKINNATALDTAGAWSTVGSCGTAAGAAPGSGDIVLFDSCWSAGSVSAGGSGRSWAGMVFSNSPANVNITAQAVTVGSSGIDMNTANTSLTISGGILTLNGPVLGTAASGSLVFGNSGINVIGNNVSGGTFTGTIVQTAGTLRLQRTVAGDFTSSAFGSSASISIGTGVNFQPYYNLAGSYACTLANNIWSTNATIEINSVSSAGGTIAFNGNLNLVSGSTMINPHWNDKNPTYSGKITGAGNLVLNCFDTTYATHIINNTANDYSGTTTIETTPGGANATAGNKLLANADNTLSPNSTIILGNGTGGQQGHLDLNSKNVSIKGLSSPANSGSVFNTGSGGNTLTISDGDSRTYNVAIPQSGSASLSITKNGSGTQTLSGANTFTGTVTLGGGTLVGSTSAQALGTGAATLSLSGAASTLELDNDSGLNFGRNTTVSASTTIKSGRLTSGAGVTHTLGTLSIGANTLTVDQGNNVASGTAAIAFTTGTISSGSTFNVTNSAAELDFTGAVGGAGGLTKSGAGLLKLYGNNNYTGDTAIQNGTFKGDEPLNTIATPMTYANGTWLTTFTGQTLTTPFSFTPGVNGMLVVAIGGECYGASADASVTWAGQTMTHATAFTSENGAAFGCIYYLPSPTNGSGNLVITYSGLTTSTRYSVEAVYATGVNQGAPEANTVAATSSSVVTLTSSGIATSAGALVVSTMGQDNGAPGTTSGGIYDSTATTLVSPQTQFTQPSPAQGSQHASSFAVVSSAATRTAKWTTTAASGPMVVDIVSFKPAGSSAASSNFVVPPASAVTLGAGSASGSLVLQINTTLAGLATSGSGTANVIVGANATPFTLTVSNATDYTFAGTLGGAGANQNNFSLVKTGSAKEILTGTNTYTGATAISNGTLLVHGSIAGSGVTVYSGGTLGGYGTIQSPVTANAGGIISAGASIGRLTFTNNVTLAAGSTNLFEFASPWTTNDNWVVNGTLTPNGSQIVIDLGGGTLPPGTYTLITYTGAKSGSFASTPTVQNGSLAGSGVIDDSVSGTISLVVSSGAAGIYYSQQPTTTAAGANITPAVTVTATNSGGSPVSGVSMVISKLSGSGTLGGALTQVSDGSGNATFTNLSFTVSGTKQLRAVVTGVLTNDSSSFTVTNAAADHLAMVQQPSGTATAGVAFGQQPVVVVLDQYGNVVSNSMASITAAASDGSTLQGTSSVNADGTDGMATFTGLAATNATTLHLNFTASVTGVSSGNITNAAAAAAQLALNPAFTSPQLDGVNFSPAAVVKVLDQYGNQTTSNAMITAQLDSYAGSGSLAGTTSATASSGSASFGAVKFNLGDHNAAETVSVYFSSTGLTPVTNAAVTVNPITGTKLAFTTQPTTTAAGASIASVVVQVQDASGNSAYSNNVPVIMSLSGGSGVLSGTFTNFTDASGKATFSDLSINLVGNNKQLTATGDGIGAGLASATSSSFTITNGAATQLALVTAVGSPQQDGVVFTNAAVVQVQDQFGNVVSNSSLSITGYVAVGTGSLLGTTNVAANGTNGGATFSNLSYVLADHTAADTATIYFGSGALTPVTNAAVTVNPITGTKLAFTTQPTTTAAGASIASVVVQVQDASGNSAYSNNVPVIMSLSGGSGVLSGTFTNFTDASGKATFSDLSINLVGNNKQLTATGDGIGAGLASATSSSFTITNGAATQLALVTAVGSPQQDGVVFTNAAVVQVQDQFGNVVSNSSLSITGYVAVGTGSLLGTTNVAANGTNGGATFSNLSYVLADHTAADTATIYFGSGALTPVTNAAVTVNPITGTKLAFTTQPTTTAAGASIASVVVQVQDASGNSAYSNNVPVIMSLSGGSGVLSGTFTNFTDASGKATFSDLSINLVGNNKQLTATGDGIGAGLASATSSSFTITNGAATQLGIVTNAPASATAGVAFTNAPTVVVLDAFGNVVSNSTASIYVTASAGNVQGTTTNSANGSNGRAVFSGLSLTNAGSVTLTFASTGLASTNSSAITVAGGTYVQLAWASAPVATYGSAFTATLQAIDQYSNATTTGLSPTMNVTVSKTAGTGTLSGSSPTSFNMGSGAGGSNGVAVLTYQISAAGAKTLNAALSSALTASAATLANRWSFNEGSGTTFADSVGGTTAVLRGSGGTAGSGYVSLGGSAYIDLPGNGTSGTKHLLSSFSHTSATFEIWFTLNSTTQPYEAFLWTFGNSSSGEGNQGANWANNSAALAMNDLSSGGPQPNNYIPDFGVRGASTGCGSAPTEQVKSSSGLRAYNTSEHYWTFVYDPASSSSKLYLDGSSEGVTYSGTLPALTSLADLNAWIGQGQVTSGGCSFDNGGMNMKVDEFRIWDGTLTGSEVTTHNSSGANQTGSTVNVAVSFTVSQAGTTNAVASSLNPAGYQDSVSFTATLTADVTAGGNVIFKTNGVAFGSPVAVSGGAATSGATTALPRGTNTITAEYAGDSNFVGSTNSLNQVVTNHAPVVSAAGYARARGTSIKIDVAALLGASVTDADGDTLTLAGIGAAGHGTNQIVANFGAKGTIFYQPNAAPDDVSDSFSYSVTDGYATNTGTLTLTVVAVSGQAGSISSTPGGAVTINFAGIPGMLYTVERNTNGPAGSNFVAGPGYTSYDTNAPGNGLFQFIDDFSDLAGLPAQAYWRLTVNP